jgi:uncharacterized protein with PQ loop repeat
MKHLSIVQHQHKIKKHDTKLRKAVDDLIYVFAILGPATTLPQVYTALIEQNVGGLSIITWILWQVITIFWIIYGFIHEDKPILISNISWFIVQGLIIFAILSFA